jgi:hypothetical protein
MVAPAIAGITKQGTTSAAIIRLLVLAAQGIFLSLSSTGGYTYSFGFL